MKLKMIFTNPDERRLRAGWRLLAQALFIISITGTVLWLVMPAVDGIAPVRIVGTLGTLGVMVLSYLVAARWIDRRPLVTYGLRLNARWWADLGFGLLLGAFLMGAIFTFEWAAGWITFSSTFVTDPSNSPLWAAILADLVVFLCVGIYEEMFSRGYQLKNLAEGLNFRFLKPRAALLLAYLASSTFFGLLHTGNPNATWVSTINLIIAGLFLGLGYILTGELGISIGLHITWNFFQGNVFGFPVSGTRTAGSIISTQQGGPELWTGGAFGPEAGLIGLLAIALGCLIIIGWVRWQYGEVELQEQLAIYQPRKP